MKNQIQIMAVFTVFLIIIPCIAFFNKTEKSAQTNTKTQDTHVKFLFTKEDKVETLTMEDYIIGAVLAQMPADFEDETLKAQAVLAHTYALRRMLSEENKKTENLKGAIMSDDTSIYQNYFTKKQAEELYGDDYKTAYEKVSKAVKAVEKKVLTYNNELIVVAFHAISGGKTESAKNAWGEDIPYLISCDSSWDKKISGYKKDTEFTSDELSARLKNAFPDADFEKTDKKDWIVTDDVTDVGTVMNVQIGGNSFATGQQLSQILSLPSPNFTVTYADDKFTITTQGYGHLVGMSQYGANYLAKEGKKYDEILTHYFKGTKITNN